MKTTIVSITIILAVIFIAATTVNGANSVFAWKFTSWNEMYPDDPLCYTLKTREQREACYDNRLSDNSVGDVTNIEPKISNKQDGLFNQNSQTSQICIAWTCDQRTYTTQAVENPNTVIDSKNTKIESNDEDEGSIFFSSTTTSSSITSHKFIVNVILTYADGDPIEDDDLRVAVYDSHNHVNYQRVDLSRYDLDNGKPIKVTFTYYNNEIPVNGHGRACVENLTQDNDRNCNDFTNSKDHKQENVSVSIPGSD